MRCPDFGARTVLRARQGGLYEIERNDSGRATTDSLRKLLQCARIDLLRFGTTNGGLRHVRGMPFGM